MKDQHDRPRRRNEKKKKGKDHKNSNGLSIFSHLEKKKNEMEAREMGKKNVIGCGAAV